MNNPQGPPLHYPNSHESTHEVYRTPYESTHESYRTPNFSRNESPRYRPPAYGAERAPPLYREDTKAEQLSDAKKRKIAYLRLAGSLLIVIIIALIVAGVIGKILTTSSVGQNPNDKSTPNTTEPASSAPHAEHMMANSPPSSASTTPTTLIRSTPTMNCRGKDGAPRTGVPEPQPPCDISFSNDEGAVENAQLIGISSHVIQGCLVSEASYMGHDGTPSFRCSVSCRRRTRPDGEPARAEVADDWGSCG